MRLLIGAVGKMKPSSPEGVLFHSYVSKTRWPVRLVEVEEKKSLPPLLLKKAESALLAKIVPVGAKKVMLDEKGEMLSSRDFAALLKKWQDSGVEDVAFLIGGANGHDDAFRCQADFKFSLGRITLPHFLARVVLVEQIYRARTILDGHPYHRD